MLSYFSVKNFRSIVDLNVAFSFAEKKAPAGYRDTQSVYFHETAKKVRLVPVLALYGSNASGKSSILQALKAFRDHAVTDEPGRYTPNKLLHRYKSTVFSANFIIEDKQIEYTIEYDSLSIIGECIRVDNELIYEINQCEAHLDSLATENYPQSRLKEIIRVECCSPEPRQKVSMLYVLGKRYPGLNKTITALYDFLDQQFIVLAENNIQISRGVDMLSRVLEKKGVSDPVKSAFSRITELLENLDIHITRMEMRRRQMMLDRDAHDRSYLNIEPGVVPQLTSVETDGENIVLNADQIRSFHQDDRGQEVEFDFRTEESSGTQIAAGLLGVFLSVLETGGLVVVDELDRSLHPLLLIELVRLFKDKRYNDSGAQLMFTVHNTEILDDDMLRKSEVGIINKTQEDGTMLRRLSDFSDIDNVDSFRKQYLNGRFSGIPFPYI